MGLLEILGQFLQFYFDLLPRFSRIPQSVEWVLVDDMLQEPQLAKRRPVLHCPFMTHIEYWPKTEVPGVSQEQTVTTLDNATITLNPEFAYRVRDPLTVREMWGDDWINMLGFLSRAELEEMYADKTWEQLLDTDHGEVKDLVNEQLMDIFQCEEEELPVYITRFCIEDRAKTRAFMHYGVHLPTTPEEE